MGFLDHAFWHGGKVVTRRDETCRTCRTTRRDALVTTSETGATCTTRFHWRRHSVDWCGHVHLTFPRICSWDWCKSRAQKTKLVHASATASSSSAMLKHASTARYARTCRVASTRDVTSQVEFGFYWDESMRADCGGECVIPQSTASQLPSRAMLIKTVRNYWHIY